MEVSLEATQFFHCQVRCLSGDGAQPDKAARVATHYPCQVIVQYSVPITVVKNIFTNMYETLTLGHYFSMLNYNKNYLLLELKNKYFHVFILTRLIL